MVGTVLGAGDISMNKTVPKFLVSLSLYPSKSSTLEVSGLFHLYH